MAGVNYPVQSGAYTVSGGAIAASLGGMHLDMTASLDHVDTSTASPTVGDGDTYLTWVKPSQMGSADHAIYPGLVAGGTDNFNDYISLVNDDGGTATSGSVNAKLRCEWDDGSIAISNAFTVSIGTWYLVGVSPASDGSVTWYVDTDTTLGDSYNDYAGGSTMNLNLHGYGYGGATDDGTGGKFMDAPGLWNKTVSSSEASDWYNNGVVPSNPVNIWHYDDDSDTTTAVDSAGTADGTINGCAYADGDGHP